MTMRNHPWDQAISNGQRQQRRFGETTTPSVQWNENTPTKHVPCAEFGIWSLQGPCNLKQTQNLCIQLATQQLRNESRWSSNHTWPWNALTLTIHQRCCFQALLYLFVLRHYEARILQRRTCCAIKHLPLRSTIVIVMALTESIMTAFKAVQMKKTMPSTVFNTDLIKSDHVLDLKTIQH